MEPLQRPEGGWDARALTVDPGLLFLMPEPSARSAFEGVARASDVWRDLRVAVERVGAEAKYASYAAWKTVEGLRLESRMAECRAEIERGIRAYEREIVFSLCLRIELADLEQTEGRSREAYAALEEARDLLEPRSEHEQLARARRLAAATWHGVHGEIDLMLGLPDRARRCFEREAELAESLGEPALLWAVLDHRYKHALAVNDSGLAERLLDEATSLPEPTPEDEARLAVRRAIVAYEREQRGELPPGGALRQLQAAFELPDLVAPDRLDAAIALAKILTERPEPARAQAYVDHARELLGATSSPGANRDPRSVQLEAFESCIARGSRAGLEARRAALERLESSFSAYLASWKDAPRRAGGIGFQHFGDRYLVADELVRAELDVHGPEPGARRALEWIARSQELGNLARDLCIASRNIDELLAPLVGPRAGLVLLVPGLQRSHAFLADAEGILVAEVEAAWRIVMAREALDVGLDEAVRKLQGFGDARLDDAIAGLAHSMLSPALLDRAGKWEHLTLIGEEFLGPLAVECFPLPDGRRLGDVVSVSHAPSLPLAAALAERARARGPRPAGSARVRVVAAPTPGESDLARWVTPPIEIDDDRWPDDAELFLGRRATREAVLESGRRGVDLLEVVAHGIADLERERSAGLLLAGDAAASGALWPEDVENAPAPAVLLLGSCGADDKIIRRGDDGRIGLAASFVLRGSDCVVLATSDLELGATLDLFDRVRNLIVAGQSPAHALRDARARARDPRVQDYLLRAWGWAGSPIVRAATAHGDAATPRQDGGERRWLWFAFLAALGGLAGVLVLRRRAAAPA